MIRILKDPRIFVITIVWMMVLVFAGTIAQKDMGLFAAQNKFFSSWIVWLWYFPFPGGRLTMVIITVNLLFFFFNKSIWKLKKLGIVILHIGGILLLVGGGLTAIYSTEGNMIIDEGAYSDFVEDYHNMELAVVNTTHQKFDSYTVFDQPMLKNGKELHHLHLPFKMKVLNFYKNCEPIRRDTDPGVHYKGMMKNFTLSNQPVAKEDNRNRPGILLEISGTGTTTDGIYGLFLGQSIPQSITVHNDLFELAFRRQRTYLPFSIELIDFKKVLHPGTNMAKSYSSEVNLIENGIGKKKLIQMNEPLRHGGYTFYQASFMEGQHRETTVLAAVKNYGRMFPYISSIIMCIGLLFHLCIKMPDLFKRKKS
ncbi:MAG: cytochrome c biogenesis protein ResB [Candidatus Marinimicrobia bacterium]|nr:cytochrome c biogenesis protein ResB [Candidatus Neomarinimicrobiota bacterium]MDP6852995.1 cytochrome c biogenesis protein ResB [Candidatus Neomarinimicrobiota bacterium]MDP6935801.1 cytochrome c biogenesis protein ResB [Candidatus Neomarinimicrobiota bacterium]